MATPIAFSYEFEYSEVDPSENLDSRGPKVTRVKCHGKLVAETRDQLDDIFKQTPFQGRIIMDLAGVDYLDSAGLGGLMRLKLRAIKDGGVSVHFEHMQPRITQLLRLANLTEFFES